MPVKISYKSNHGIKGSYEVPLDKSIAQRSAILGISTNTGVEGEDIVSTKKAAKQIRSGADNLCLDMGNSGTGMRLIFSIIHITVLLKMKVVWLYLTTLSRIN